MLERVGILMGKAIFMDDPSPEIKEAGKADEESFGRLFKHLQEHGCGEQECIDRTILCDEWYLANTRFREAIK